MEEYKGYKTKIHCPDCQTGFLRILSSDEVLKMFPMSRAVKGIKNPEINRTHYTIGRDGEMHERWARPKYLCVFCDLCNHQHDVDERSVKRTFKDSNNKLKLVKIKGYGTHFRR